MRQPIFLGSVHTLATASCVPMHSKQRPQRTDRWEGWGSLSGNRAPGESKRLHKEGAFSRS